MGKKRKINGREVEKEEGSREREPESYSALVICHFEAFVVVVFDVWRWFQTTTTKRSKQHNGEHVCLYKSQLSLIQTRHKTHSIHADMAKYYCILANSANCACVVGTCIAMMYNSIVKHQTRGGSWRKQNSIQEWRKRRRSNNNESRKSTHTHTSPMYLQWNFELCEEQNTKCASWNLNV